MERTAYCGLFSEDYVGRTVTAMGWVENKRDMGGVIFLDLRDREGTLQVVCNRLFLGEDAFLRAERIKNESVVSVTGGLRIRDGETYNPRLATGTVELRAQTLTVLSESRPLPFPLDGSAREELRLKYRYLDLRRPAMYENLRFRHALSRAVRDFLEEEGFLEVETPMLTKSTPEGARDYLVPSRVSQGSFYALPQSPQVFKQLLMIGGVDRYYQIARCFRDEDLRADRQPEFTQVDMELSFVEQEDILRLLERLFRTVFEKMMGVSLPPFPRITWSEAMDRYGTDKPDLRFGLPIVDVTPLAAKCGFSVFRQAADRGGAVRAINVKGGASLTRTAIEELTEKALSAGAKGMAWIALKPEGIYSILTKYFTGQEMDALLSAVDGRTGDFILFCADAPDVTRRVLGSLRLELARMLDLRKKGDFRFLIVTDFPQFEYSQEENRYIAAHHPFTMPCPEDIPYLKTHPDRVRAQAYDFVLNGVELGSGSIRIHRRDIQEKMFEALGFSPEEIERRFGFFVNSFQYGAPPHGGFAFGLDRLVMLLREAGSLRDVLAFPKIKDGSCPLTGAPGSVDGEQLAALGISLAGDAGRGKTASAGSSPKIDVDRTAALSKLFLPAGERESMEKELSAIVAFSDRLCALDTENASPTAYVLPLENVLREDEAGESFPREALLASAPQVREGCLYVPRVV